MEFGLTVAISLLGTWFFAWLFYRRGFSAKAPRWAIRSTPVITSSHRSVEGLKIWYRGQQVSTLTVSTILFWNAGRSTLDKTDIATANPPRIVAKEGVMILEGAVVEMNNPSSDFSIQLDAEGKSLTLLFEYLNNDDGAVIRVIHTGSSASNVHITGALKGVKVIKQVRSFEWIRFTVLSLSMLTMTIMLLALPGVSQLGALVQSLHPVLRLVAIVPFILGLVLVGIAPAFWLVNGRRIGRPPRGLDAFEREQGKE